jgi:uncharacterized phage-associated protein
MEREIRFKPNVAKAVEVILWFCHRKGDRINKYNLLKALYYAEKEHLNRYGRPIIGDTYYAMEYGTVPSLTRDLIEQNRLRMACEGITLLPFHLDAKDSNFVIAKRKAVREELFSKSDLRCLEEAYREYGTLSFSKLRDLNHDEKAWKETWKRHPNAAIPFELLIKNKALKDDLRQVSQHMVL